MQHCRRRLRRRRCRRRRRSYQRAFQLHRLHQQGCGYRLRYHQAVRPNTLAQLVEMPDVSYVGRIAGRRDDNRATPLTEQRESLDDDRMVFVLPELVWHEQKVARQFVPPQ